MKKLSSLLLALAGSLACSGANGVPSHIVQPLPRELDPRLEQPLTPPSHIVRPLTEEETARRERELAPVPTAGFLFRSIRPGRRLPAGQFPKRPVHRRL